MAQPIAGWYTDPSGDTTKLRYWDGTRWTDSLMDAPAPQPTTAEPSPSVATQAAAPASAQAQTQAPAPEATQAAPAAQAAPANPSPQATAYDATYQQPVQPPVYTDANGAPIYVDYADAPLYYVSPQDSTLRLVAFILALISTVTAGFAIIPLAWMIPMTVMTWGIYKGKRPNTIAFDVCSLIFLNVVGGILLLVTNKDE